jgi:hypothetical protein
VFAESVPESIELSRRIIDQDMVDAHRYQPAEDYWRDRRLRFWRETQANAVDVEIANDYLPSPERSPEALVVAR